MKCNKCGINDCNDCEDFKKYGILYLVRTYMTNIKDFTNYCNLSKRSRCLFTPIYPWHEIFGNFKLPIYGDKNPDDPDDHNVDWWLHRLNYTYNISKKAKKIIREMRNYNMVNIIPTNPSIVFLLLENMYDGLTKIVTNDDVIKCPKIFNLNAIDIDPIDDESGQIMYKLRVRYDELLYKVRWFMKEQQLIYFLSYLYEFDLIKAIRYLKIKNYINSNGILSKKNSKTLVQIK